MKGKDDPSTVSIPSDQSSGKLTSANDASSGPSLVQQEKLCKELYLSMGVHPTDIADTSDDDVASILEQMSRLQPRGQESGGSGDRNIEDILREAESLLDGQNLDQPRLKSGCTTSRSGSVTSGRFVFQGSAETCLGEDLHGHDSRQNSQGRKLDVTHTIQSSEIERQSDTDQVKDGGVGSEFLQPSRKNTKGYEAFVPSHLVGTPLEVTYKRIYDQIRKEVDGTLKPHLTGDFPDLKLSLPIPGLETPSYDFPGCFNLEQEFLEERKRCLKLKADLDWLRRQHEREVSDLRRRHEGQLNQIREELRSSHYQDPSVPELQNEIKVQKQIISGYHQENEKMCVELREIKRVLLKLMALLKADNDSVCIYP